MHSGRFLRSYHLLLASVLLPHLPLSLLGCFHLSLPPWGSIPSQGKQVNCEMIFNDISLVSVDKS